MSSISGFTSPTTTTTSTSGEVLQTTATSSSPTVTLPDFTAFARSGLQQDTSGLTAPKTPEMSSAIIDEILALAEELAGIAREDRIRASASAARGALGPLIDLFTALNAQSETTFNWQTTINNLNQEKIDKQAIVDVQQPIYNTQNGIVTARDQTLTQQWNYYNGLAESRNTTYTGYINEANNPKTTKERLARLHGTDGAPGLINQGWNDYIAARDARDNVYRMSNPTYAERETARGLRDAAAAILDPAKQRVSDITNTDLPNAQSSKAYSQALYETSVAFTTLLASAMGLISGIDNAKKTGSDEDLDAMLEESLAALIDKVADLRKLAADITIDWTQGSTQTGSTETGDGAQPMPRAATMLLAFLTALGEVGRALAELSDLKGDEQAGIPFTNDRYRLAV